MRLKTACVVFSVLGAAALLSSCNTAPDYEEEFVTQDIVASPAAKGQIKIDGVISPGEWDDAQEYQLERAKDWGYGKLLPRQRAREDKTPLERGYFKVKYDDKFLYVLGSLKDADLVQTSMENQALSFGTGDMIEIFLKPEEKNACWEIYGTPWGHSTTLFYPWAGHTYQSQQKFHDGIKTAAVIHGTINNDSDTDSGWDIEVAIPRELIEKAGEKFDTEKDWRILLCRYNYGRNLPSRQISSTPRLPRTNHHLTDYYAKLKFKK